MIQVLCLTLAMVLGTDPAAAAPAAKAIGSRHYVDAAAGADTNPGTAEAPWKTWARAQTGPIRPGATVYCTGELGPVQITAKDPVGKAGAPITYARWPDRSTPHITMLKFDPENLRDVHLVFQEFRFDPGFVPTSGPNVNNAVNLEGANHVAFESCEFEGPKLAGNPQGDFAPYCILERELCPTFTSGDAGNASYISIRNCTFANSSTCVRFSENAAMPQKRVEHWEILGCEFTSGAEDAILATRGADLTVSGCRFSNQNYAKSAIHWPGTAHGTWPANYTWGKCTQDGTGASALFYRMGADGHGQTRIYMLPDDKEHLPRRSQYGIWRLDSDPTNIYFEPSGRGECPHTDCIAVQGPVRGMLIENNRFEVLPQSGQIIKLDPCGGHPEKVVIQNNLFLATPDAPTYMMCIGGGVGTIIRHNTIYAGTAHMRRGLRVFGTSPDPMDVTLCNNIISGGGWQKGVPPKSDYNCWIVAPPEEIKEGPHSIVVPGLAALGCLDATNLDFRLTESSPCINKGNPEQAPGVSKEHPEGIDHARTDRDAEPDIGAYEYVKKE
ncbi:MAG TPA: right-handed parallel beta-helix repeat-containing protein [Phycisphaerae bacterium]|nr:right-handed parallel beta-helix repeat-containing protein [Phycisphaerae bacterium]